MASSDISMNSRSSIFFTYHPTTFGVVAMQLDCMVLSPQWGVVRLCAADKAAVSRFRLEDSVDPVLKTSVSLRVSAALQYTKTT